MPSRKAKEKVEGREVVDVIHCFDPEAKKARHFLKGSVIPQYILDANGDGWEDRLEARGLIKPKE